MGDQLFGHSMQRMMELDYHVSTGQLVKPRATICNSGGCLRVRSALMTDKPSYCPVRVVGVTMEKVPRLTRSMASRVAP
jgi:hypothetical protein